MLPDPHHSSQQLVGCVVGLPTLRFPGVKEQGYPDLDELIKIRKRIRSWGLDINRVTLPNISEKFLKGLP